MASYLKEQTSNKESAFFKSSPLTSATSLSSSEQRNIFEDCIPIEEENTLMCSFNKVVILKKVFHSEKQSEIQTHYQKNNKIYNEIMQWFAERGIQAGHPEDLKKQYNRKLHKKVSLLIQNKHQPAALNNFLGSTLLQRRLQKKMTIEL